MKRILFLTALVIALLFFSCGKSNPAPQNVDTGNTGGTGTGGTGTGGTGTTTYTVQPDISFNTWSASVGYDIKTDSLTNTETDDADKHGVQTTTGGSVAVSISNISDTDIDKIEISDGKDAVTYIFKEIADPVLTYTVKDDAKKTITKYIVHTNKELTGGGSKIQIGGRKGDFTGTVADYNAKWLLHIKSGTQAIQILQTP